jgi:hypothetical protein
MSRGQIIYEVNLSPDPSIEPEFDGWLEHHVEEMLELPGFVGATIHRSEDPADDRPLRSVHYRLRDRAALDAYLADHAARMRADGVRRFGDRFQATRRILDGGRDIKAPSHTLVACANCGTLLHGQYCANCGQRARDRMISLWELVTEASEILTSLDSRLWRTLAMLLFRPGQLTRNYLLGRRARYIPALRLFLGLSLLFFFLFSLDTHFDVNATAGEDNDVDLQIGLGSSDATDPVALDETTVTATEQALDVSGLDGSPAGPEPDGSEAVDEQAGEEDTRPCADVKVSWPENIQWMNQWLSTERVQSACEKIAADHGASFTSALLENIPGMMFLFLPLMAAVMKILYPLSSRYYVEHLLFLVHYHSFFYLLMSMNIGVGWVFDGQSLPEWPANLLHAVSAIYIPVYLFRAMRVVYHQGRLLTGLKYVSLGLAYTISLALFLVGTVTFTAVSL